MTSRPTALVTGATGGIGLELARSLASTHDLVLTGRSDQKLAALRAEFPNARVLALDLSRPADLAANLPPFEALDVLIHNAGVAELGTVAETPADVWDETMRVNVLAPAELTRLLLQALRAARGHVVFVNSGAGLNASPGWGPYAASKFALKALADALRGEESSRGVRVTTVYPGRTATDMQRHVRQQEGGAYQPDVYIRPSSVARTILAVLSTPRDALLTDVTVRPSE
ncbi:SDR family oxidoreductase [Deinococcus yavapaiensis]|uniref:NADP-dependent 3-hydroxy acid dehydrogenase YdfG n=1 Tax=Deinococcus yavapaiensis KR-236 TaxID=694435 RepID=A0A318S4D4_9DEIO|nr:SDR family oxidoreductase [Deinococcus yavapaiensis]PYE52930.1 NADP-dependent 3-hydroxy acid dehydrogenase YdfG [Deinococcus yavapaiensis KR-236]